MEIRTVRYPLASWQWSSYQRCVTAVCHARFAPVLLLLAVYACDGCGAQTPAPLAGVLFYGCSDVRMDGDCVVHTGGSVTLSVWIPTTNNSTTAVFLNGVRQSIRLSEVGSGVRFKLAPKPDTTVVEVRRTDEAGAATWRLDVAHRRVPKEIGAAERLRRNGAFEEAKSALNPLLAHRDRSVRGVALGRLARVALQVGQFDEARALFQRSIEIASQQGSVGIEIDDRSALAFLETNAGRYDEVEAVLGPIEDLEAIYPAAGRLAFYYRALLSMETGDVRRALRTAHGVLRIAEQLDLPRFWSSTAGVVIETLDHLGRKSEARALLRQRWQRIPDGPACVRADALNEAGWRTIDLGGSAGEDAKGRGLLREAEAIYRTVCPRPRRLAHTRAFLGLVELKEQRTSQAAAWLKASHAAHASAGIPLKKVRLLLEAELALASRAFDRAARAYARLVVVGAQTQDTEIEWLARVGRAQALALAGRSGDAVAEYYRAERLLDRGYLQAPMGAGRGSFLRGHADSGRQLVDLLLRMGRSEEASTVARHSRARSLLTSAWPASLDAAPIDVRRSLYRALFAYRQARSAASEDQTAVWGQSNRQRSRRKAAQFERDQKARDSLEEALSALGLWSMSQRGPWKVPQGTVLLSYHPTVDGWAAFAVTEATTVSVRLANLPINGAPEILASKLLAPFSDELRRAQRVQIAAADKLARVAFHVLPFDGEPLIWKVPVTYKVDVLERNVSGGAKGRRALVVAPHIGLRATQAEASAVSRALGDRGWLVRRLGAGSSRSTLASVFREESIDWLHYAGHARLDGIDGWSSTLGTADAPLWTVGDILSMPRGPRYVVLSACESGAQPPGGAQFGLGQAFVLAGAEWAVAATAPVEDEDARLVAEALYARLWPDAGTQPTGANDAGEALRLAVRDLAVRKPTVDWQRFVVLER